MTNRIREALAVLGRRGWTKQTFTDDEGRHCLQGALHEAHGAQVHRCGIGLALPPALAEDVALVNEVIREQYPERAGAVGVSQFNDHPETVLEDVVAVLEKAALRRDERI